MLNGRHWPIVEATLIGTERADFTYAPGSRVAHVLPGFWGREVFDAIAVADLPQTAWVVFGAPTCADGCSCPLVEQDDPVDVGGSNSRSLRWMVSGDPINRYCTARITFSGFWRPRRAASAWGVAVVAERKLKERRTDGAAVGFCPISLGAHAAADHPPRVLAAGS